MPNDVRRNLGPSRSQSTTYEAVGHAEDLSNIITNIDPDRTFFLNRFGSDSPAVELDFSWLTEGLRPPKVNAHREKEDYVSQPVGSVEGLRNNCQRFVTSGYVTEAQRKVRKVYTEQDEFVRLLKNSLLEHATDIEYALVNNDRHSLETAAAPAITGGVPFFMRVQNIPAAYDESTSVVTAEAPHGLITGDFVYFIADVLPTGLKANTLYYVRLDEADGVHAFTLFNTMKGAVENIAIDQVKPTTAGTNLVLVKNNVVDLEAERDFTLDDLTSVMEMCFNRGGNPTLAVMSPAKKRLFSQLVFLSTQVNRNMKGKDTRRLEVVADAYETDFGAIEAKAHRLYPDNRIDLMDLEYWALKWFVPTHQVKDIAKVGSYDEYHIESWLGLKGTQPKASGSIINILR